MSRRRHGRTQRQVYVTAAVGLMVFVPTYVAVAARDTGPPDFSHSINEPGAERKIRLPPDVDGVAPPENPDISRHIAANKAFYSVRADDLAAAKEVLEADTLLTAFARTGGSFKIATASSWRSPSLNNNPIGVSFHLTFPRPVTAADVTIPTLSQDRARASYRASVTNIRSVNVLVSLEDQKVVQVIPVQEEDASVMYITTPPPRAES